MGNYKSRPSTSCTDELKKKISEGYAVARSRLGDDVRPRHAAWTALHTAAYESPLCDFLALLAACPSPADQTTPQKLSLMHLVAAGHCQQVDKLRALVSHCGPDASSQMARLVSSNGFSPLHIAIHKGDIQLASLLFEAGADVRQPGRHSLPSLHIAAIGGNAAMCKLLVEKGADMSAVDLVHFTALHCAAYFAHEQVLSLLLSLGACPNSAGGVRDRPLHLAAGRGSLSMLDALLQAGADPMLADDEGNTSVHFAAKGGHVNVIQRLLESATNSQEMLACRNVYGDRPLHSACYAGRLDAAKALLRESSAGVNAENVFSETPLHAACTGGKSVELVAFLMRQPGVDANYQGQDGHTALHSACYHGHAGVVQHLLENGADQSLCARACDLGRDPSNMRTAAMAALIRSESSSTHSLSSSTASPSLESEQTPVIWAYEKGHDRIVALLKHYANQQPDETMSEYSSGESSYTPLPSPLGRLKSMAKEKAEILQLRSALRPSYHLSLTDVDFQEAIGSGSFGKVYKGTYKGKIVAIKRYRAVAFGAKTEVDMLCREVSILSRLNHPNVIAFVGAVLDDPSHFAIMTEFVENGSLFTILHEQKRVLEPAFRLRISLDVAKGMHYLHEGAPRQVIHRDLNSHNILVHGSGRAVVADFGESRFAEREAEGMTKQPGNLRWMAPEVFSQSGRYDKKVDVFSFALCVWELHAAELPFAHLKPAAAAAEMAYKRGRPSLPPCPTPQWPAHIIQLLGIAWHPHRDNRPAFSQIVAVLEPHVTAVPSEQGGGENVSQLKSQWEQLPETRQREERERERRPLEGWVTLRSVDELRSMMDSNGYIAQ